ncbi:hypothetical protein [Sandarakinorhabdus sp.]|uniref:hypothetical protein n=1 Tax=Sandarakinorhabdus sp. TaxID=1916663 RepID=UPI00286E29DA|nr:hypothetical protein [Sandarakinorhabdus sp.]
MALDPAIITAIAPVGVSAVFIGTVGWVMTTWLKIKNGYPLESSWGKPMLPIQSNEQTERIRLLSQENGQLRAELGAIKDRLQVLERIATDAPARLSAQIDQLQTTKLN